MKNLRAASRLLATLSFLPVVAALSALQGLVVGPLTGNYTVLPNFMYGGIRRILGYKVVFNKASAPLVKDRPVWFLANHMSTLDFIPTGVALKGNFIGKSDVLKWPVIRLFARAVKFIGVTRKPAFNAQVRGKIAQNFNAGYNAIMFPEATITQGDEVKLFHAGLLTLLFGDAAQDRKKRPVRLKKDVVVQPVAIQVKAGGGKTEKELRAHYQAHNFGLKLSKIWKSLQVKRITLELTVFNPLDPKAFKNAQDLANAAARDIAGIVNPGQTTFEKAVIPANRRKRP